MQSLPLRRTHSQTTRVLRLALQPDRTELSEHRLLAVPLLTAVLHIPQTHSDDTPVRSVRVDGLSPADRDRQHLEVSALHLSGRLRPPTAPSGAAQRPVLRLLHIQMAVPIAHLLLLSPKGSDRRQKQSIASDHRRE